MRYSKGTIGDFIKETRDVKEIKSPETRLIMVMGGSDTGKTTLVESIVDELSRVDKVAVIDLDMGQSHLGPPTTVAWGSCEGAFSGWHAVKVEDFYFTGTLSPPGSLLPAVTGARFLTDRALARCNRVVVDTTGLITEPAGRVLKHFKIDLLSPDVIIGLEREGELNHILDCFRFQAHPRLIRVDVPSSVSLKNTLARTRYRAERFKSYFSGSPTIEVSFEKVGIRFTRERTGFSPGEVKNRVVSLRDKRGIDVSLGIIDGVDLKKKILFVRSPIDRRSGLSTIVIGSEKVTL